MYMRMKVVSTLVFALFFTCMCVQGGCPWYEADAKPWSSPSTWPSGKVPAANDIVVVPAGLKVRYDVTTTTFFTSITVETGAQLVLDGSKSTIVVDTNYVLVKDKGALRIGSADCLYTNKVTITLYGPRDNVTQVAPFMGNKGIISAGALAFYGAYPTNTWTRIENTVVKGSTWFTVKDDIYGWNVGDRIVLATTDYYEWMSEVFFITAISGRNISLDKPVAYLHWGANDEYAEVGLLTRNILIQGDISSDASLFGGHTIVHANGTGKVQGVEFARMGQAGVLARYPMHYHFQGNQSNSGSFINGCSFRNNYQRCFTIHGTSGIRADKNVGYNVTGHCFFFEEGSETNNTLTNNLGIYARPGQMIPSDAKASIFWVTNPSNSLIGNVAVGGNFGFWFSLPYQPLGMSKNMTWIYPQNTPFGLVTNNAAHSNIQNGFQVDECPNPDGTTVLQCNYMALNTPGASASGAVRQTFHNITAWKNRQYGIWIRGLYVTVNNAYLIDNGIGINIPTTANLVQNTLIVGETPNLGMTWMTKGWDDKGRSRPKLFSYDFPIHGLEVYDSAGNQFAQNVTMKNFFSDSVRYAGAIGAVAHGYYILPANNIITQINIPDGSNVFITEYNYGDFDGPKHLVLNDGDGSWTGDYGGTLVGNSSLLTYESNCTTMYAWGGYSKCQRNENGYSHMTVLNTNPGNTEFGTSFSMTYRATVTPLGRPNNAQPIKGIDPRNNIRAQYAANVYSRRGYLYTFPHPTPPQLQVNLRYASSGEWIVAVFSYPNTAKFNVTRGYYKTPILPGATLDDLSVYTYFYDQVNQYLYVMYTEDNGGLEGTTGFPQYQWGSQYVDISASCGKSCTVTAAQTLPPALKDREDKYRSTILGCNAGTSSPYKGTAYFNYNNRTKLATYVIYHSVPRATTAILSSDRNGQLINFPVPQSPMRGVIALSYSKWNDLWAGKWTITIGNDKPANNIEGTFGCVGICQAPPLTSNWNPCTSLAPSEMPIFVDQLNSTYGWIDWSWLSTVDFAYTADTRCGSKAIAVTFQSWGALSMHLNGACAPGTCTDLSWQKPFVNITSYKYFEFYAKSPTGPLPASLSVRVQDSKDVVIGTITLGLNHIDSFFIENLWTRVRVPFKDMGLKGTELVGTFSILVNANIPSPLLVLFDHIKLVSDYADPITKAPYGSLDNWDSACYA